MSQEAIAVAQDTFLAHGTWNDLLELQRRWMFDRFTQGLPVAFVSKGGWIARAVVSAGPGWSVTFVDHHYDADDEFIPPTRAVTHEWVRNGLSGAVGFVDPERRF